MNSSQAGKGDKPRPVDRQGWETSRIWDNFDEKKAKRTRIFNENKHLIKGSNITDVKKGLCGECVKKVITSNGGFERCKGCK